MNFKEFIMDNNNNLQIYNHLNESSVYLYARNYVGIKNDCIKQAIYNNNPSEIPDSYIFLKDSLIDYIKNIYFLYEVVVISLLFLCSIFKIVFYFLKVNIKIHQYMNLILIVSSFILIIFSMLNCYLYGNIRYIFNWALLVDECSDEVGNYTIFNIYKDVDIQFGMIVVVNILIFLLFFIIIIEVMFDKEYQTNNNDLSNDDNEYIITDDDKFKKDN